MATLGRFKSGATCIYVNQLADLDMGVLGQLIALSYQHLTTIGPDWSNLDKNEKPGPHERDRASRNAMCRRLACYNVQGDDSGNVVVETHVCHVLANQLDVGGQFNLALVNVSQTCSGNSLCNVVGLDGTEQAA